MRSLPSFAALAVLSAGALATPTLSSCSDALIGAGVSLTWSPRTYSFPETQVLSSTTAEFRLVNNGAKAVSVKKISLVAGAASVYTISEGALSTATTLAPRAERLVVVRYAPTSTAEARATLRAESDASTTPIDVVISNLPPAPKIEIDPASIEFGTVPMGETHERLVTIRNAGTAPMSLQRIALAATTSREFQVDLNGVTLPATLDILNERKIKVKFSPSAPGSRTGQLEVLTDDPRTPVARAPLSVGASTAGISVAPLDLPFGPIEQGTTATLATNITNTGNAPLIVTPTLVGSSDFSVPGGALTIAPNVTTPLVVTYAPSNPGTDEGILRLAHNDATQGPIDITLTGGAQPSISVSPLGVQFSNVAMGQFSEVEVVLTNVGYGNLALGAIVFGSGASDHHADFTLRNLPAANTTLARGRTTRFTVRYTKNTVANPTALIQIASNDPDESQNPFPLYVLAKDGIADFPPTAVIACSSCNGTTQQGTLPMDVELDGSGSSDPAGQLIIHSWTLLSIPNGSQAVIDDTTAIMPSFSADVLSTYRVGLVVQDTSGQLSPRATRDITVLQ